MQKKITLGLAISIKSAYGPVYIILKKDFGTNIYTTAVYIKKKPTSSFSVWLPQFLDVMVDYQCTMNEEL